MNYRSYKHLSNEIWITMLRATQNLSEAIKRPPWQRIFRKILWNTTATQLLMLKKFNARERVNLSENNEIFKTEKGIAEVFNNFLVIL